MTVTLLLALMAFAFVSSITPGPNNLMLMASGANFGFKRSIPHMLGISVGFVAMTTIVGLVLMQIFDAYPVAYTVLRYASAAYLLYLAYRIARAAPPGEGAKSGKPFSFLQAAAFQWVNPKAWTMAINAMTQFAPDHSPLSIFLVAAIFGLVNLPSVSTWTLMGTQIRRFLTRPARLHAFNITMALLLIASMIPVWLPH
jgi:threonine/homoserine/homoserine lactone efflux protein